MLQAAAPDRRRAAAVPRLLVELRPGPAALLASLTAVRRLAGCVAGHPRAARRDRRAARVRARRARGRAPRRPARAPADAALAAALPLLAWLAVAGAMAFPTGPGPNPAALALGLGALLAAPRSAGLAGALAGLAAVFRPEIGVAAALGAALLVARARAVRALARAAPLRAPPLLGWLPFFVAAPGELLDQTLGFLGIQDLQRLPFPLDPAGVGLDPNKLLELAAGAPRRRRGACGRLVALPPPAARALALAPLARRRAWPTCSAAPTSSTSSRSPPRCRPASPPPRASARAALGDRARRGRRAHRAARPRAQGRPARAPAASRRCPARPATACAPTRARRRRCAGVARARSAAARSSSPAALRPGHRRQPAALRPRRRGRTRRATTSCSPAS